mgnify:CR=1 FL=1
MNQASKVDPCAFTKIKIFPRALDIALTGNRQTRIDLASQASGRVLEVGIGTNLPCHSDKAIVETGQPSSLFFEHVQARRPRGHTGIISGRRRFTVGAR